MMLPRRSFITALAVAGAVALAAPSALAQDSATEATHGVRAITLASTTSTQDSGLFAHLLPAFELKTGITVRVIAQGTGQALDTGRRGDADAVLVHAKAQEEKFVADGAGVKRYPVMYNDFVLIGPGGDPAGVRGEKDIAVAMRALARTQAVFISRGDRSGTHAAELKLWQGAGIDIEKSKGPWYREIGQGMGAALNMAAASPGYVLSDRATWLNFKNKADLEILVEGDRRLFNQYGVILVDPTRHPHVKKDDAQAFIDWLVGADGQRAIADYKIDGKQLFFPNANAAGS